MSCWKRADEEAPQETLNWTPQMKKIKDHFKSIEQTEEQDKAETQGRTRVQWPEDLAQI